MSIEIVNWCACIEFGQSSGPFVGIWRGRCTFVNRMTKMERMEQKEGETKACSKCFEWNHYPLVWTISSARHSCCVTGEKRLQYGIGISHPLLAELCAHGDRRSSLIGMHRWRVGDNSLWILLIKQNIARRRTDCSNSISQLPHFHRLYVRLTHAPIFNISFHFRSLNFKWDSWNLSTKKSNQLASSMPRNASTRLQ